MVNNIIFIFNFNIFEFPYIMVLKTRLRAKPNLPPVLGF